LFTLKNLAKKYLFSGKDFYSQLLVIAIPIIIQNFISSSLNMVDTVMIGRLGETEIAAVGLANQFFLLYNLLIMGIHSGCSVLLPSFGARGKRRHPQGPVGWALGICERIAALYCNRLFLPENIVHIFLMTSRLSGKEPLILKW